MQAEHTPRTSFRRMAAATLAATFALGAAALPAGAQAAGTQVLSPQVVKPQIVDPHPATAAPSTSADTASSADQAASSAPAPEAPSSSSSSVDRRGPHSSGDSSSPAPSAPASGSSSADDPSVALLAHWWGRLYADALGQADSGRLPWLTWLDSLPQDAENKLNKIIESTGKAAQPEPNSSNAGDGDREVPIPGEESSSHGGPITDSSSDTNADPIVADDGNGGGIKFPNWDDPLPWAN